MKFIKILTLFIWLDVGACAFGGPIFWIGNFYFGCRYKKSDPTPDKVRWEFNIKRKFIITPNYVAGYIEHGFKPENDPEYFMRIL